MHTCICTRVLLKGVFEDLCKKNRLGLRCEATWGGTHDLKSLAAYKGKKRLVWLDQDASTLLSTYRSVGKYASNLQLLHLLWDPREVHCCVSIARPLGYVYVMPDLLGA